MTVCRLCGGEIGPDVTGRPMCYSCGPSAPTWPMPPRGVLTPGQERGTVDGHANR